MREWREVYDVATNEFLYGGLYDDEAAKPNDVFVGMTPGGTQRGVVLSRPPNRRREQYSGTPEAPFADKSQGEIAAWDGRQKDRRVDDVLNDLTFQILSRWIAQLHGLTPVQARQQLRVILRGLL